MRLDEVRNALAQQAALVPPGQATPDAVLAGLHAGRRRRRVAVAATVAVVVAALAGTVATVVATRSHGQGRVVATGPTIAPTPRFNAGFTVDELRGHDGVDAPPGWVAVDAGDARVFVPAEWFRENVGSCIGSPTATGMVSIGKLGQAGCAPANDWPLPAEAVALVPSTTVWTFPRPVRVVHGYRIYLSPPDGGTMVWGMYEVPQLGIRIALHGTLGDRVLATLGPSARKVALAYATQPIPGDRRVSTDGLTMTLPTAWTLSTPSMLPCTWPQPLANGGAEVLRITPGVVVPGCPATPPTAANALHDGMYLYPSRNPFAPRPEGAPVAVLRHAQTTIRVFADTADPAVLELFVQRAGSAETHVAKLGLGKDGRIAGGVLASIEATS